MINGKRKSAKAFSESKSPDAKKAFNRIVRLLYRRDHSLKELETKLKPYYEAEAIQKAIEQAHEYNYIKPPEQLSQQFARSLHTKNKGYRKILLELQKKGLPKVAMDPDIELEKARLLLEKLLPNSEPAIKTQELKLKQKAQRHLMNKGFDFDIIRQIISERFR